jgi:hypothetical protein
MPLTGAVTTVGPRVVDDRRDPGSRGRLQRALTDLAARVDPRVAALVFLVGIAFFGIMGELHNDDIPSEFYLDREGVLPAQFSAAILIAAGVLLILARNVLAYSSRRTWLLLGLFLLFMSLDEWRVIHENLEKSIGVDWQLLYIPIVIPAGIAWCVVLRDLWRNLPGAAVVFASGAVCWVVAQALEDVQWGEGDILIHPGLVPPEEMLEMGGSALFAIAALMAIRAGRGRARASAQNLEGMAH